MDLEFSTKGTCSYYLAREPIIIVTVSFIFQKKNPLQQHFNKWFFDYYKWHLSISDNLFFVSINQSSSY